MHYDYGFGAVDASLAVLASESWLNVNPNVPVTESRTVNEPLVDGIAVERSVTINGGSLLAEAVEIDLSIAHDRIGDLRITLTSPSGTESLLMDTRNDFLSGFTDYRMTSVRHWDEPSAGTWTLRILDDEDGNTGTWLNWSLTVQTRDATNRAAPCDLVGTLGEVDVLDLLQHVEWFLSGDQRADQECDDDVDVADLLVFLECWFVN